VNAAREEILARTRDAIAGGAGASTPRGYRVAGRLDARGRLELLRERLADYRAQIEHAGERDLPALVERVVAGGRVVVPPGLPDAWQPRGAIVDDGLTARELDGLDGVLTGCTVAIAETGTLVLSGGPTEGRRALTLVPDLHVCVVRPDQVVETLPEAFVALRGLERRPLTFISGPSATSDIELSRVEGVHGPRTLVVVILEQG
jgi:L-lactate dehydrogenase complex protein LldG